MNDIFSLGMDSIGSSPTNSPTQLSADAGSTRTSSASRQFPAGIRVLVVDDDHLCLKIVEKMLRNCQYDVTTCSRAAVALSLLRERKGSFDLVLSDVYMPDMDGFKLLELIGLEMDLPVIMMSADDSKDVVLKGVTHGAVDYVIKPVRMEVAKNLWQHVARKNMCNDLGLEQTGSVEENDRQKKVSDDGDNASSGNGKRRKDDKEEGENEEREDSSSVKKPRRVVWSVELHQQFVAAVKHLSVERAVPKKILEIMKVPGLTRENVASHLQKYRLYLKRLSLTQNPARPDTPFQGVSDVTYGSIDAINGFSLPHKNHMNMNVGTRQCTSSGIGLDYISSNPQISNAMRMVSGQQWSSPGQMNLITGASFNMESRQSQLLQAYGSFSQQVGNGSPNLLTSSASLCANTLFNAGSLSGQPRNSMIMQMQQQQGQHLPMSRKHNNLNIDAQRQAQHSSQLLNGVASGHDRRILSSIDIGLYGEAPLTGTMVPSSYGLAHQAFYSDLQNNYSNVSVGNSYPFGMGTANLNSTSMFQECVTSSGLLDWIKPGLRGVKDANQTENWKFHSTYPSFELPQHADINFSSSISTPTDFIAAVKDRNTCAVSKDIYKIRSQCGKVESMLFDNAVGSPSDGIPDLSYADTLMQNDFLDMINPQELAAQPESEFDLSAYQLGVNFL